MWPTSRRAALPRVRKESDTSVCEMRQEEAADPPGRVLCEEVLAKVAHREVVLTTPRLLRPLSATELNE